jgi:hypothetical protein
MLTHALHLLASGRDTGIANAQKALASPSQYDSFMA